MNKVKRGKLRLRAAHRYFIMTSFQYRDRKGRFGEAKTGCIYINGDMSSIWLYVDGTFKVETLYKNRIVWHKVTNHIKQL